MSKTKKKQIGFYADPDIEEYLKSIKSGVKSIVINAAIRGFKKDWIIRSVYAPKELKNG